MFIKKHKSIKKKIYIYIYIDVFLFIFYHNYYEHMCDVSHKPNPLEDA